MAETAEELRQSIEESDTGRTGKTLKELIVDMRPAIERALPKAMDPERFARIALTTLNATPQLQAAEPVSFLAACMFSAQLGLEPGGPLQHAHLVPRKRNGVPKVLFIIGYRGYMELARRSGEVAYIMARDVFDADEFDFEYGSNQRLVHRPVFGDDRGEVRGYYAFAKLTSGESQFVVLTRSEALAFKRFAGTTAIWNEHERAMCLKTAVRQLMPWLPQSPQMAQAYTHDESYKTEIAPSLGDLEPDRPELQEPDGPLEVSAARSDQDQLAAAVAKLPGDQFARMDAWLTDQGIDFDAVLSDEQLDSIAAQLGDLESGDPLDPETEEGS